MIGQLPKIVLQIAQMWVSQTKIGVVQTQWSHFPSRVHRYLASFKPYLLFLLLNYLKLNFILLGFSLKKDQGILLCD